MEGSHEMEGSPNERRVKGRCGPRARRLGIRMRAAAVGIMSIDAAMLRGEAKRDKKSLCR